MTEAEKIDIILEFFKELKNRNGSINSIEKTNGIREATPFDPNFSPYYLTLALDNTFELKITGDYGYDEKLKTG